MTLYFALEEVSKQQTKYKAKHSCSVLPGTYQLPHGREAILFN